LQNFFPIKRIKTPSIQEQQQYQQKISARFKNMVKEKADHQRYYDMDGFKKRAACVCVKNENENEVTSFS